MRSVESMRCVVLGGGGFIGVNLCRRLAGRVASLKAFGRRRRFPEALEGVEWLEGDFDDEAALARVIEGADTVFHLINTTTPASANADKVADLESNVLSSVRLLEICRGLSVRKVVFASSGGTVYGITRAFPTNEDVACWPITSYGIAKLTIERYLHLFQFLYGLDYRILRVSNPFGPYQTAEKKQGVIAAFAQRIANNQNLEVWGDGSVTRDYVYIDDVTEAFELAARHEGPDRVFNIGSGVGRSLNEVIETLASIEQRPLAVERRAGRLVDVPTITLDVGRAERSLGWTPNTDFKDGLRRTLSWMRDPAAR